MRSTQHAARSIGSIFVLIAAATGALSTRACSSKRATPAEPVAATRQEITGFGMERVIPLRFVMMTNDCDDDPGPLTGCMHQPPQYWGTCTPCAASQLMST